MTKEPYCAPMCRCDILISLPTNSSMEPIDRAHVASLVIVQNVILLARNSPLHIRAVLAASRARPPPPTATPRPNVDALQLQTQRHVLVLRTAVQRDLGGDGRRSGVSPPAVAVRGVAFAQRLARARRGLIAAGSGASGGGVVAPGDRACGLVAA